MSTPQRPDDARDPQLSAAHAAGRESPPAALDAAVLAAARQAVAPKARPALRRWAPPVALAASLVMGLAFLLAQQVQQEPEAPQRSFATEAAISAQVSPDARRDEPAPVAAREYAKVERAPVHAEKAAGAPATAAPATSAPPPAPAADLSAQAEVAYAAPALERAATARTQAQAAARAADSRRARSEAEEMAEMAVDDAEDIAAWLAEIQALRDAGKQAEAVRQLMAFCEAYPGHKECPEP